MPRKKKTKPMDPSTGMREFLDREAEHRRQEEQAAFEIAADRSLGDAWRQGWKKLELAIPAYLAGESSRTMVDEISELDKLVDAVGYAGRTQSATSLAMSPTTAQIVALVRILTVLLLAHPTPHFDRIDLDRNES